MQDIPTDEADISAVITEIEAVEFDPALPGWAALCARLAGGSSIRLEFDAKAFVTLETAISAAQRQMTQDQGVQ
ncbi:hypothetical protein [Rhizobium sp. S163]|uniref:hypothetical protein n=1 Tax=Rhizobium sp. S163 TaxID=3055039 RepID=UPI000DD6EA7D|nr:hypothetical protein [Rhizobium sp. S163]MDM9649226.1 hypothetical protein [Rhizobium sp. S163]